MYQVNPISHRHFQLLFSAMRELRLEIYSAQLAQLALDFKRHPDHIKARAYVLVFYE